MPQSKEERRELRRLIMKKKREDAMYRHITRQANTTARRIAGSNLDLVVSANSFNSSKSPEF